jgi:uncharacterized membrane protein YjfL (UPF0719 family)
MPDFHSLNIALHIGAGVLALVFGLIPLLSRKGGHLHRLTGWLFVMAGFAVLACAVIGVTFYPQPGALVMATLSAGYQYVSGLRALPRFRQMPGWLDAGLALAALVACGVLLTRMTSGSASWPPAVGYATLGFLLLIVLYDLSRFLWRQAWQRIRALDHGLKMTGAYFAFASAGLGNLLRGGQPWSQILPSVIGLIVMLLLLTCHIRDKGGVRSET